MTSSCVSKTMSELQHIPTGFGWMKHLLPAPLWTQQAASLQYFNVSFQEQSFAIMTRHLLGLHFHTCDTLVFVIWVTQWLRYAILMWGKRPSKGARSNSVHIIKSVPPFQLQPTQLRVIHCAEIVGHKAVDFYRKLLWSRRWFWKVESRSSAQCQLSNCQSRSSINGIRVSSPSAGPCNLISDHLTFPITAALLCCQRKAFCWA